jgi:hypothetical protein
MDVRLPDGTIIKNVPEGTTRAELMARLGRESTPANAPEESPTSAMNLFGAAIEPMLSMASGAVTTPLSGIAGLLTGAAQDLGLDKAPILGNLVTKESPADVVRGVQSKWTYQPQTEGGRNAMSVIGAPFEALEKGADYVGGKVSDVTGSPMAGAQTKAVLAILPALLARRGVSSDAMPSPMKAMRGGAETLMRSSLKPSVRDVKIGNADKAVKTMLDEGVSVSEGGINKLSGKIDTLNEGIRDAISGSNARISRRSAEAPIYDVEQRFSRQAAPQADIEAIQSVLNDFQNHPLLPLRDMPVQIAQELKQGTYRALKDKYGEVGSASTEAQKALARGLKDEVAKAVPEVAPLNAQESALLNARNILGNRLAVEGNKNPMGLGPLASTGGRTAAFMADRSALLKSMIARAMNPGKGMGITDEMVALATAPETFTEDSGSRMKIIEALMGRL